MVVDRVWIVDRDVGIPLDGVRSDEAVRTTIAAIIVAGNLALIVDAGGNRADL